MPSTDDPDAVPRARKRPVVKSTAPAWERTRFFNDPHKRTAPSLPTISRDGAVRRPAAASTRPKFVASARSKPGIPSISKTITKHSSKHLSRSSSKTLSNSSKSSKQGSKLSSVPSKPVLKPPVNLSSATATKSSARTSETRSDVAVATAPGRLNDRHKPERTGTTTKRPSSESVVTRKVKRARSVEDYAAKLQMIEAAKTKMANLASGLIANPQQKIGNLKELRAMAAQNKGRITALVLLTEAQVFKDLAPAYRIRPITEKEAAVKVSKEVLQLRTFEQALLSGYQRFIRSCISLSRWRAAGNMDTPAAKDMANVRLAACKALAECLRALPHFNDADMLVHAVCALVADREPEVRGVSCEALTELLANAHKASGQALSTCVSAAKQLSVVAGQKSRVVAEEVVAPLSKINFAGFAKLPISQKPKNARKKSKRFDRKLIRRGKAQKDDGAPSDDDIQKDLAEAEADSAPQEMYTARKSLLDSACHACFNIIKAASADVIEGTPKDTAILPSARKKPPPALSAALRGLLQICRFINTDIVEAIIAALTPILSTPRYPLVIRLRSLSAAYAVLGMHARSKQSEADAVTSDAREMDHALYSALGGLYSLDTRVGEMEDLMFDAMETVISAHSFRNLPAGRAAAMARRICVWAAGAAPTHTCALGLVKVAQLLLDPSMVSPIFVQTSNGGKETYAAESGLITEYDLKADDPDVTNAMQSAAWELSCLVHHFHPAVREIAAKCSGGMCGSRLPKSTENIIFTVKGFVSKECGFNPPPSEMPRMSRKKLRRRAENRYDDAVVSDVIGDTKACHAFLDSDCAAFSFIEDSWAEIADCDVADTDTKDRFSSEVRQSVE